jgi:tetratricopeptide (TPR) repeat protein
MQAHPQSPTGLALAKPATQPPVAADQIRWEYAGNIADLFPPPVDDELDEEVDEEEIDVDWYLERAAEFKARGNYARAIGEYAELVRLLPDEPDGYQGLAWIWANCPHAQFRNGTRAVEYATRAVKLEEQSEPMLEEMEADETLVLRAT